MHCLTAWGQWAVQLLQRTASLPGGSGQCKSYKALHHYLGAVAGATPATHCLAALGSGHCNSRNALPHCLGAVGSETPAIHCFTTRGVGSATLAMHCLTTGGQCAVQLLQRTPSLPGAVGSASAAIHCLAAWGQWVVQLLQHTASLPWGSGPCNSCNTLPHCLGAVGTETPAIHCFTTRGVGSATPEMHCETAWGQWAVQLLQFTASLPEGTGQCNSCNAPPHCLWAVGGATVMNCLTALGQ